MTQPADPAPRRDKDGRPAAAQTSHTIGYDSAQKSGYDSETEDHEARRTTNEVAATTAGPNEDRDTKERAARRGRRA